jgi:hypothetical protein
MQSRSAVISIGRTQGYTSFKIIGTAPPDIVVNIPLIIDMQCRLSYTFFTKKEVPIKKNKKGTQHN